MAKHTYVKLIDDIDGSEAQETVKFGIDGLSFEIDLSGENAAKLRDQLQPYVDNGQRVGGRLRRSSNNGNRTPSNQRVPLVTFTAPPPDNRGPAKIDPEQNRAIRRWAVAKGLMKSLRGRLSDKVIEQYNQEAGRH